MASIGAHHRAKDQIDAAALSPSQHRRSPKLPAGANALLNNVGGTNNTATGMNALYNNTAGTDEVGSPVASIFLSLGCSLPGGHL